MTKTKKRYAILTSGGDSPGMNTIVGAFIKNCFSRGIKPYLVRDGYKGLTRGLIAPAQRSFSPIFAKKGGTAIGSSRFPEFQEVATVKKAQAQLAKHNITGLVTVGGDGTFQGAARLSKYGTNCIAVPGTIDNDINNTDFTVGFPSTVNIATDALDSLRATAYSHSRCIVVEVMGRHRGDIAIFAGIASLVNLISVPEMPLTAKQIVDFCVQMEKNQKRSLIIVVTENQFDVKKLAAQITQATNYNARSTVIGYVQRGTRPCGMDRFLAWNMGRHAVEALNSDKTGISLSYQNNIIVEKALSDKKTNFSHKFVIEALVKYNLLNGVKYDE